jgi:hypothetical protein
LELAGGGGHIGLRFARVDEPRAAQDLFAPVLEDFEEKHVDRHIALVEVADDALGGVVELGCDEKDLVGFVEIFLIQCRAKALLERLAEITALGKTLVDLDDLVGGERLDPGGVVERLRYDFARGAVAFELDEDERGVGSDRQQVNAATQSGGFLTADEHPFAGKNLGRGNDHVLQLLFVLECARGQGRGRCADFPEGVLDGHGLGGGEFGEHEDGSGLRSFLLEEFVEFGLKQFFIG